MSLRDLNAASATLILIGCLVVHVLCVTFTAMIFLAKSQWTYSSGRFSAGLNELTPALIILSPVVGGFSTVVMSLILVRKSLLDTSPAGAAWVGGSWRATAKGFLIGFLVGSGTYLFMRVSGHHADHRHVTALARMAMTPGLVQALAVSSLVFLAPPAEEILFRGVLFGGYRKSFGTIWAAVLTTALFIFFHLPQVKGNTPAFAGLAGVSMGGLYCRLHFKAIGPAIGVHAGYNAVIAFLVVYRTWL